MHPVISDIHRILSPFLVTGLAGTGLTHAERDMLSAAPPAGLIIFPRNVDGIAELRRLTDEVTSIVVEASGLPPLVMADHEGGRISVLAGAIGVHPPQMAAWRPGSVEILARLAASAARTMRACGINLSLSPLADVNSEPLNPVIGTRAFGEDPERVSAAVRTVVRAMRGEGMLSCLKHFPGHGAAALDSHLTLPVIGKTLERLREEDLPPFIAGIGEGADTVMTAHIALTGNDPPASLDPGIVTGLLREELGFGGVVITDALEMAGALPDGLAMSSVDPGSALGKSEGAVPAAVAARALGAGNDLLLMSRPLEEIYDELALHEAALGEELSTAVLAGRMEESAPRIASLRSRAAPLSDSDPLPDDPRIFLEGIEAERLGEKLLTDRIFSAAGDSGTGGAGWSSGGPLSPVFLGTGRDFEDYVVRRFISRVLEGLDEAGPHDPGRLRTVMAGAGRETGLYLSEPLDMPGAGRVLVVLCRRPPPEDAIRSIATGFERIVVAGRPWDAALFPSDASILVTYGIYDAAADRVSDILRKRQ